MREKILLIGGGGHCKVVLDVIFGIKKYAIAGIIDTKKRLRDKVSGVQIIGTDDDLAVFFKSGVKNCFVTIGSIGDPDLRIKSYKLAKKIGFIFPNLISPHSLVSLGVELGEGNYIAPGAIINSGTKIGNNCIVNTGSIIEHDCVIGDFVHLSPGTILSGGVKICKNVHIGTGSILVQDIKVGEGSIIGAGSVVVKDIRKGVVAYGSPCKEKR